MLSRTISRSASCQSLLHLSRRLSRHNLWRAADHGPSIDGDSCPVTALASLTSHRIVEAMSSGVHKRPSADASSKICVSGRSRGPQPPAQPVAIDHARQNGIDPNWSEIAGERHRQRVQCALGHCIGVAPSISPTHAASRVRCTLTLWMKTGVPSVIGSIITASG